MNACQFTLPSVKQQGFTLLETVMALGAATVLMVGLASAIRISSATMGTTESPLATDPLHPTSVLQEDLSQATDFETTSSTAITMTVPDRNGDSVDESILYRVRSSTLERAENGSSFSATGLAAQGLSFASGAEVLATPSPYAEPTGRVLLQSYSKAALVIAGTSMTFGLPPGTQAGDLLLYGISIRGDQTNAFTMSGTWNSIDKKKYNSVLTICTGWRFATASESTSYLAGWSGAQSAGGYLIRLSGAGSSPIHSFSSRSGTADLVQSSSPREPNSPVLSNDSSHSIVRFIAFDRMAMDGNLTGLPRHLHLPFVYSPNTSTQLQTAATFRDLSNPVTEANDLSYRITTNTSFVLTSIVLRTGS